MALQGNINLTFINMEWIYLVVHFALVSVILNGAQTCKVENVHITLGDYFADRTSPVVYRVGFMSRTDTCQGIKLKIRDNKDVEVAQFDISVKRNYDFKGLSDDGKSEQIEYARTFYFFELRDLPDYTLFRYQLWIGSSSASRVFNFESSVYIGSNYKMVAFGDHDKSPPGLETVDALQKTKYDLLLLLGDVAYEIYTNNGETGDEYFAMMEDMFTKAPVVMTPGNHESLDMARFLNTRFIMPGTISEDDNNFYTFQIGDTLFYSFNFDLIIDISTNDVYRDTVRTLFEHRHNRGKPKWSVFLSHRPFYCSLVERPTAACLQTSYQTLFYENLMHYLDVNLYLHGHIHTYERYTGVSQLDLDTRQDRSVIISGSPGNGHFFKNVDTNPVEFLLEYHAGTVGYVLIEKSPSSFRTSFINSKTGEIMDSNDLASFSSTSKLAIVVLGVIFIFLCICLYIKWRKRAQIGRNLVPANPPLAQELVVNRMV